MELAQVVQLYHSALDAFGRGDPEPAKSLFSRRDDVTLANPFGPTVRGWQAVARALDYAAAQFREGDPTEVTTVAEYLTANLATIVAVERWRAKVAGRAGPTSFELRVTSTFRREDGAWKLVHRHADPIATPHPEGPLRAMDPA
jgi:ketosteroid isomerase-like protein